MLRNTREVRSDYGCLVMRNSIAAIAAYNVYAAQEKVRLSDLVMANVEALADNSEFGFGWVCESYVIDHYSESRWNYYFR